MSINVGPRLPVELEVSEHRGEGVRSVQFGIKAWASAPYQEFDASTDYWEGGRVYELTWEQLLALQEQISTKIATLQPLLDSGKVVTK